MAFTREQLTEYLSTTPKVIIDLGCGPTKRPGSLGIDHADLPGVDFVADLEVGLGFLPDNSVDDIYNSHFLEHIENLEQLLSEIHRCLKPGGRLHVVVPHFSNPYYYSDYTHKKFFGLYSFDYFSGLDYGYRRKTPSYNKSFRFRILSRRLIFRSPSSFVINLMKKHILTRLFNSSKYMQSVYEESFCYTFPCYELIMEMEAMK
ncbi:MAG: class I SAM-dependent methyltransferase [Bacteroidota bacterium]